MTERSDRFEELFAANQDQILGFLLRRTEQPADAADLLAETFLTAWRRLEEVPERADLWLLGVARRMLSNHRRGRTRRSDLADRLRLALTVPPHMAPDSSGRASAALASLSATDREVLTLTAWEGLAPAELAIVLGVSESATRVRLHRARSRLRARLAQDRPVVAGDLEGTAG